MPAWNSRAGTGRASTIPPGRGLNGMEAPGGVLRSQSSPPVRVQQTFPPVKTSPSRSPGSTSTTSARTSPGGRRSRWRPRGRAGANSRPDELLDAKGLVTQRSSGGPTYFSYMLKGARRRDLGAALLLLRLPLRAGGGRRARGRDGKRCARDAGARRPVRPPRRPARRPVYLFQRAVESDPHPHRRRGPQQPAARPDRLPPSREARLARADLPDGPLALYTTGISAPCFPKMVRDMREAQTVDGLVPDIAPEYVDFRRRLPRLARVGQCRGPGALVGMAMVRRLARALKKPIR